MAFRLLEPAAGARILADVRVPEGTVWSRLNGARKQLVKELGAPT